jgi:hypothetical protein
MNVAQTAPRGSRSRVSAESAWPLRREDGTAFHQPARGMSARRAKTAKRVEGEARQPGPKDAPKPCRIIGLHDNQGFLGKLFNWRKP